MFHYRFLNLFRASHFLHSSVKRCFVDLIFLFFINVGQHRLGYQLSFLFVLLPLPRDWDSNLDLVIVTLRRTYYLNTSPTVMISHLQQAKTFPVRVVTPQRPMKGRVRSVKRHFHHPMFQSVTFS